MWRLRTTEGDFAIKRLNPTVVSRPGALDRFRASERAAGAFKAAGIRTVVAHDASADPLREIHGAWFLAYPWIDALTLPLSRVSPEQGRAVGAILGQLHRVRLSNPDLPNRVLRSIPADQWAAFARRSKGRPRSGQLDEALPVLTALSHEYVAAVEVIREQPSLVSHRDVVPENILWDSGVAWLIDWESVARTNPLTELVSAAIDWSGYIEGRSDRAIFEAVLAGYESVMPFVAAEAVRVVPLSAASWLPWLAYSLNRALGDGESNAEERSIGVSQTVSSLRAIAKVPDLQRSWREWLTSRS